MQSWTWECQELHSTGAAQHKLSHIPKAQSYTQLPELAQAALSTEPHPCVQVKQNHKHHELVLKKHHPFSTQPAAQLLRGTTS